MGFGEILVGIFAILIGALFAFQGGNLLRIMFPFVGFFVGFSAAKQPELNGFNRRGLYRMKQFYETYTNPQFVSTASTLLQTTENETTEFVTTLLTQIQWSAHLHILSKTKTTEEKIFYLKLTHDQNLSVRELERQLNTSVYERTMLSNTLTERKPNHLPQNIFKDPFIF